MLEQLISDIEIARSDSIYNVMTSFVCEYNKYLTISCNIDSSDVIIQEGKEHEEISIADKVNNDKKLSERMSARASKDSNKFISFLMFIPRLVMELFNSLGKMLKGNELKDAFKELKSDSKHAKKSKVKALNKVYEGKLEFYYDEKSDKIKFKKTASQILDDIFFVGEVVYACFSLKKQLDKMKNVNNSSDVVKFIDDIDITMKGGNLGDTKLKHRYNILSDGVDALGELLDDISTVSVVFDSVMKLVQKIIDGIMRRDLLKDQPDAEKQKVLAKAHKLISDITAVSSKVSIVTAFLKQFKGALNTGKKLTKTVIDASDEIDVIMRRIFDKYIEHDDDPSKGGIGISVKRPRKSGESEEDYMNALFDIFKNKPYGDRKQSPQEKYNSRETFGFAGEYVLNGVLKEEYKKAKKEYHEEQENAAKQEREQRKQNAMNTTLKG